MLAPMRIREPRAALAVGLALAHAIVLLLETAFAAEAPDPLAKGLCDAIHGLPARRKSECCSNPAAPSHLAELCTRELAAALRRGGVTIDASGLERCTKEAAEGLAGCGWVAPLPPKPPASRASLIVGKITSGASCRSSLECGDGLHCRGASTDRAGVCAPPSPPGGRCAAPVDNLAAFTGLQGDERHRECEGLCLKGQCLSRVAKGAPCPSSALCAPGLHCSAGHCAEPKKLAVGATCERHGDCAEGAYCAAGTCATTKRTGEPCSALAECGGFACERPQGAKTGKCADPCSPGGRLGAATEPATTQAKRQRPASGIPGAGRRTPPSP